MKALADAGVPVVAGTDEGIPGHSLHREIELYAEAGFTPLQALQAATIVPARAMGLDRELGTIERGKRADLTILAGNPLDDIHNIRLVRWTVLQGRDYGEARRCGRACGSRNSASALSSPSRGESSRPRRPVQSSG
ncbi:MAG: amidohydrolase family protein [Vicinamibacterales bacterium]